MSQKQIKINYAQLILIQLESLGEKDVSVTGQLNLLNEILRDAKQLAEMTMKEDERDAA